MTTSAPRLVLVVSDLHLAEGRDPVTGRIERGENFFADLPFGRFLDHHLALGGRGSLLVINGDAFDFLRVMSVPRTPADFERWRIALADLGYEHPRPLADTLVKKEHRYGLRTDHYKTIWKFREIVDGHPAFFAALRRWVAGGGHVAFIKGNHDLELHWPLLQHALRRELAGDATFPDGEHPVTFHEDDLDLRNVHIEHGHRFEAMTRVTGEPTIYRGEEIRLPFASFFNKYVINHLEGLEPFLDNIKPASNVVQVTIRKHPLAAIRILFHGLRALKPILIRDSFRHVLALLLLLVTIALPVLALALVVLAFIFQPVREAVVWAIGDSPIRRAVSVLVVAAPWLVAGGRELVNRRRRWDRGEDRYGEGMYHVARDRAGNWTRFYGVVGHTHRMDIQDLGQVGTCRCFYLNSGSWTPRWEDGRPDLGGQIECSFLHFTLQENGEYAHEALEWRDELGTPAPAVILSPGGGRRPPIP